MRLLILGGTGFIGPHQVCYALARGHRVTVFNRGRQKETWPGPVEELLGYGDSKPPWPPRATYCSPSGFEVSVTVAEQFLHRTRPGLLLPAAVEYSDAMPAGQRVADLVRADETRATQDQQAHRFQRVSSPHGAIRFRRS